MAKANKCDVCGNFYDPKDHGDNDIAWIKIIDKQDICMNSIDLCPQCSKQLDVFLERYEEKSFMQKLEKILEETEQLVNMHYEDDSVKTIILRNLRDIRKHMNESQCGECSRRRWYQIGYKDGKRMNDGWIPVEKQLPEKNEYFVDTSSNKEFPNGYYRRLEIAYMTDTVEYIHGYYDGYKWMDKYLDAIKNVVAWRIHEPYRPERSE